MYLPLTEYSALQYGTTKAQQQQRQCAGRRGQAHFGIHQPSRLWVRQAQQGNEDRGGRC